MRQLITGAGGFAGQHLIHHLITTQQAHEIHGTVYNEAPVAANDTPTYHQIDLTVEADVEQLINDIQPDMIYHLAAQSSPAKSYEQPWRTLETNLRMQFNLIEACLHADIRPRLLVVSSGEIYQTKGATMPLTEDTGFLPGNAYSLSKITQDMMGWQYVLTHDFPIIRARPFNHTGPGQAESFVAPDFAMQIARIEAAQQAPVMRVGNLSARRDFTDVRDTVRAYALLMQHGDTGGVYNIASNQAYSIQWLLDTLLSFTDATIDVQIDEAKLRPVDVPLKQGDYTRLHDATGWEPQIPLKTTLHDLLNDCRQRVTERNSKE